MNIKQLKEIIENLPDDAEVLILGDDYHHSYNSSEANYIFVEKTGNYYFEYYGDDFMRPNSIKEKHLVIC